MSPDLDPGLVAITIAVIVAIVGLVLWLVASGNLDQIEDARTPPAWGRRTGTRGSRDPSVPSSQRIREGLAEWRGARGPHIPTRTTATGGTEKHPSGAAGPDPGRPSPRRTRGEGPA